MKLTLAVLTLSACSAATCPSDELYGHDAELVYLECGGLQLEVTADTLTVVTDDGCRDVHGVRWER